MEPESKEKDNVFRERTDSFSSKRKKIDSSGDSEDTNSVLEELKLIRKDLDLLKKKNEEKSNSDATDICGIRAEIKNVLSLITDVKDCLKSVDYKIDKQEKRMDHLEKRLDAQNKEIHSLREKLQKTEDRVVDTEHVVEKSSTKIKDTQDRIKKVDEKAIDLGARSRRNNLIFHGIAESPNEDSETCKKKVYIFNKEKCELPDDIIIEVAHRLGAIRRSEVGSEAGKPRPMIAKFLNRGDRDTVKRTKKDLPKDSGFGITEDFPKEIRLGRSKLIPKMIKAKNEGHQSYISYPCRLIIDGKEVERIDPAAVYA